MAVAKHSEHFLAEWRLHKGLTQEELAEAVGVAHNTIGRIENGGAELRPKHLRKIAKALGVPRFAVLEVDPTTDDGKQMAALLTAWERIAPEHRGAALAQMETFAANFPGLRAS